MDGDVALRATTLSVYVYYILFELAKNAFLAMHQVLIRGPCLFLVVASPLVGIYF